MKLIVQVELALIYIPQFISTYVRDFTAYTCSKYINHYLLTKAVEKLH